MRIWDDVISPAERAEYDRAGWGGLVGFGQRPALIVVDMYRAFVDPEYPFSAKTAVDTAHQIGVLLEAFRRARLPVFFSTGFAGGTQAQRGRWKVRATTESPLMLTEEAYAIWPELEPAAGESLIVKAYPSAFAGTTLAAQLNYHRVDTLVVTGTVTSGCVRGTVLDAFYLNYRVMIPEECVCDRGATSHKVALFEMHTKYGDVLPLAEVLGAIESIQDRD